MATITYKVEGMHCTSCALNVHSTLKAIEGIEDVRVDLATKTVSITMKKDISFSTLSHALKKSGYVLIAEPHKEQLYLQREKKRLLLAWLISLPLSIKMLLSMIWNIHLLPHQMDMIIDLILSSIVVFVAGFPVIKNTFLSLKNFRFTMDTLLGIGSIAALSTGVFRLFHIDIEDFSIIGAMIIAINSIGNAIKAHTTQKTTDAIKKLIALGAKEAHLIVGNTIKDIPVSELKKNDIVLVKAGEKIPSDGIIIEGSTSIDESMISGESLPVDKSQGDKVIGATINLSHVIKVKIEKIGEETFLSQIITLVEKASTSKVPIQQLADKVTAIFVPLILLLALLTFLGWFLFPDIMKNLQTIFWWSQSQRDNLSSALFATIATLVIACPCALGLATPTALLVGMGKAASLGILFRHGEAIQRMKEINTIVFDKTGTLTTGKPRVQTVVTDNESLLFDLALGVEKLSTHPLAHAIVEYIVPRLPHSSINPVSLETLPGKGMKTYWEKKKIVVGSLSFLQEEGVPFSVNLQEHADNLSRQGMTIVGVGYNDTFVGMFGIADTVKEEAPHAIHLLHRLGYRTAILTGDTPLTAQAIASKTGIQEVHAGLLPNDKITLIQTMQQNNGIIAMVGDGINDAPALKQADVGIAIGTGTEIAIESADITLIKGNLNSLVKAFLISRLTFNKIKQNLFWAFFYNTLAIPLAMLGILHPLIAEIAMAISSLTVVGNSLHLSRLLHKTISQFLFTQE